MKYLIFIPFLFLLSTQEKCNNKKAGGTVFKGRLEVKGMCMNYTIKLLEGNLDTSMISSSWTDEAAGKSHTNVFALGSPCTFPASINEGGEFYFQLDNSARQDCAQCMAYYPTPPKKLMIKVVNK